MLNDAAIADASTAKQPALHHALPEAQAAGHAPTPVADESWDIVRVLSCNLRGRYRLTITLCIYAALIGAAVGWFWAGPTYQSNGMVRITSVVPAVGGQGEQNQSIPMFGSFMEAQQGLVTSRSFLDKARHEPIWNEKGVGNLRPSISDFAANLKVDVRLNSENLRICYNDPNDAVASAAVESVIDAYQNVFVQENQRLDRERLQSTIEYRDSLTKQLTLSKPPTPTVAAAGTTHATTPAPATPAAELPLPEKVALVDPNMARLIDRREDARDQLEQAGVELGPNHPVVVRLTEAYDMASQRVDEYLGEYISLHSAPTATNSGPATVAAQIATVVPLSASMQQAQDELDRVDRHIEMLKAQAAMPKRIEVVNDGDLPILVPGRQIKWTATGGGLGAALVLGFMVLLGMYNKRFRVYEDVIDNMGNKLRFIAAVPNLDADSEPRHWADAAQAVHHFRLRLDQNGSAFLVTSADDREGRTSVVMSLALSFCGTGARTLIIDADLATRGLTRALKLENCSGFFEMLRDGEVGAPLNTPTNSIAVLPAGMASETDGLSISGPAIARLLTRLKSEFDVVLIDTGPALEHVETCVMARHVDGVLLTICRGTPQSLWNKTMEELNSVGAVCAAVFNRVLPRDFDRYAQRRAGAQVHAQPRPVVGPLAAFGPLVQAVAMSHTQNIKLFPVGGESLGSKKVA